MKAPGICPGCRKKIRPIQDPYCLKCGKPLSKPEYEYCYDCRRHQLVYTQGRSLYHHEEEVARAIYQLKFHNRRYYGPIFGHELALTYGRWIKDRQITQIIPVPIHRSRYRTRGYNQAALIARTLGKELGIEVADNAIRRVKKTRPQKVLNDKEREANLKGAFAMDPDWIHVENVLLIDDIYTTGSTINTLSKLLLAKGAHNVYFLTISIGQGI